MLAHPARPARATVDSRRGRRASRRQFIIEFNKRRLRKVGLRFRRRLVEADGRTVRFADGSMLQRVDVVVWATGYRSDYTWIHMSAAFQTGRVVQHTRGSALLGFVNEDAAYLADQIAAHHRAAAQAGVAERSS